MRCFFRPEELFCWKYSWGNVTEEVNRSEMVTYGQTFVPTNLQRKIVFQRIEKKENSGNGGFFTDSLIGRRLMMYIGD